MNIDEQIEFVEKHLKYLRCYPSSDEVFIMYMEIFETLKQVKKQQDKQGD